MSNLGITAVHTLLQLGSKEICLPAHFIDIPTLLTLDESGERSCDRWQAAADEDTWSA